MRSREKASTSRRPTDSSHSCWQIGTRWLCWNPLTIDSRDDCWSSHSNSKTKKESSSCCWDRNGVRAREIPCTKHRRVVVSHSCWALCAFHCRWCCTSCRLSRGHSYHNRDAFLREAKCSWLLMSKGRVNVQERGQSAGWLDRSTLANRCVAWRSTAAKRSRGLRQVSYVVVRECESCLQPRDSCCASM